MDSACLFGLAAARETFLAGSAAFRDTDFTCREAALARLEACFDTDFTFFAGCAARCDADFTCLETERDAEAAF